jgi:hypothetical protein
MGLGFAVIGALVVFDIALAVATSLGLVAPWMAGALLLANPLALAIVARGRRAEGARKTRSRSG